MKTHRIVLVIVAAALSVAFLPSLPAAPRNHPAMAYRVSSITKFGSKFGEPIIERGATRFTVLGYLGAPSGKLGSDVWVYRHFAADLDEANDRGCDTMLITFSHGYVTEIMLVNDRAFAVVAAPVKANPNALLAATK